ncbi:hypothetical protein H633G_07471 [Metarhizium anisopliae BRIP 53284]|nr:hypothetical protein H633G_07471 [Metarhizium anisopliae BRIP 53284]
MISSKIPAYLAFAALIAASPVAITDGEGSVFARGNSVDDCGASTFENHYSNGSPLVAAGASPQISPMAALGPLPISAIDIIDLINESINRFQWQDKVDAAGNIMCQTESSTQNRVAWGLYHT